MALPVGIQLGVELTSFVAPLTKAAFKLGSIAAREAIERSGSDELTELKLANILGRLRIDAAILTHFRAKVAPSGWKALSPLVKELVLEYGSGPTVAQALASDNPALLSMIVQLSFLAWSHDRQDLALAITQVVEEVLSESGASTTHGLNYVALLGTIGACQQQTAAFTWQPHYEAVENKFQGVESGIVIDDDDRPVLHSSRGIPFTILSALVRSLESVQRFPEEYVLQLCTDDGITSIVVWCYYVLDLSIAVQIHDRWVYFGEEPYNIAVTKSSPSSAVLLQRASEKEPLFTLQAADFDPPMREDKRLAARGYLKTWLQRIGVNAKKIQEVGSWILSHCLQNLDRDDSWSSGYRVEFSAEDSGGEGQPSTPLMGANNLKLKAMKDELRSETLDAASFLFGMDLSPSQKPSPDLSKQDIRWESVMMLIYALARVRDRNDCGTIPLSIRAFDEINIDEPLSIREVNGWLQAPIPTTIQCFAILCRLLVGHGAEHLDDSFLVSAWGWSIFFTTMDAVDPAEVASGRLYVKPGVPARGGVRKARIVDGKRFFKSTASYKLDTGTWFNYGACDSKLRATQVGYDGLDAFTVLQTFDMRREGRLRLGFLLKQKLCAKSSVLASCPCYPELSESSLRQAVDGLLSADNSVISGGFVMKYPEPGSDLSKTPERVFHRGDTWYYFASGSPAARLTRLYLSLEREGGRSRAMGRFPFFIRGPRCCVRCAVNAVTGPAVVIL